jgi:NAD dependent epimerase/dehydratase family enzyme
MNKSNILLTGGLGYIGSHIAVELLLQNNNIIIIDNLSNSTYSVLDIIEKETNKKPIFKNIDLVKDIELLDILFTEYKIDLVIHLAGLKSVNESINVTKELSKPKQSIWRSPILELLEQFFKWKKLKFILGIKLPNELPYDKQQLSSSANTILIKSNGESRVREQR